MINKPDSIRAVRAKLASYRGRLDGAVEDGVIDLAKQDQLYFEKFHQGARDLIPKNLLPLFALGLEGPSEAPLEE